MAVKYTVKGAAVKVSIGSAAGNRVARILRKGAPVPEGIEQELLDSLAGRGLIEAVVEEPEEKTVEIPDGDPSGEWTVAQLEAYAAREDIDIKSAKNKDDKLTAIQAAKAEGAQG